MPDQAFAAGYLVYLLFIFLPGVGFGELLGIWKKIGSLSEKFALGFGLGLSIDTVIMLVRTSGIDGLRGIDVGTIYLVIGLGFIALLTSLVLNNWKLSFISKPTRVDLALFVIILIQGGMLLLYFQKYSIFPQYESADFANHVGFVQGLISGTETSIPRGILYFGVHYQLASAVLLVGGEPLVTLQRAMGLLITLAPLLFYLAANRIFSNNMRAGLVAAVIYTLSGTIWYVGPLDSGLYPNFFGILSALFLLIALTSLIVDTGSLKLWVFFILALINGYMSHYTFITILPAILLLPLVQFLVTMSKNKREALGKTVRPILRSYLVPAVVAVLPAIVPFIVYPNLGSTILYLASSGGGLVTGSSTLSTLFTSIPFVHYLAIEVYDDIEFVVLFVFAAVYLYKAISSKKSLVFIPIIWFIALAFTAPFDVSAWRFSYEAIVPLLLMASYGIYALLEVLGKSSRRKSMGKRLRANATGRSSVVEGIVIVVIFGGILIGAYGQTVVVDSAANSAAVSQSQTNVYNSIYWLEANTPNNSKYLSVSDWRFTYSNLMIDRSTYYSYVYSPSVALSVARNISAQYIIVTQVVTAQVPNSPSFFPWNNFPTSSNSNFTLLYSNPDVRIYKVR